MGQKISLKKILAIMIGIAAVLGLGACGLFRGAADTEVHTAEFTPKDGFVYFTDINEPITLDVNLVEGSQFLEITMDNGTNLHVEIRQGTKTVYEGDIEFTGELEMNIPEEGAYQMVLSGKNASGDLHYKADGEKEDRGTIYID